MWCLNPLYGELSTICETITSLKSLCAYNTDTVDNLHKYLGELSTKIHMNQKEVATSIGKTAKAISTMKDGIGGIENKTSEILKNIQVSFISSFCIAFENKIPILQV